MSPILETIGSGAASVYGLSSFTADPGAVFALASLNVTSGTQPFAEFTNIPQNYKHLQVRAFTKATQVNNPAMRFGAAGSLDSGSNYSWHHWWGNGSVASSNGGGDQTFMYVSYNSNTASTTGFYIDIFDYASTSKFKHMRSMTGSCNNSSTGGEAGMFNGAWRNTAAINTLRIYPGSGAWDTGTIIALYGIKGDL